MLSMIVPGAGSEDGYKWHQSQAASSLALPSDKQCSEESDAAAASLVSIYNLCLLFLLKQPFISFVLYRPRDPSFCWFLIWPTSHKETCYLSYQQDSFFLVCDLIGLGPCFHGLSVYHPKVVFLLPPSSIVELSFYSDSNSICEIVSLWKKQNCQSLSNIVVFVLNGRVLLFYVCKMLTC